MTLEPGDLIATGTPAGVGPLRHGDVVEVEIPGVGVLSNPVTGGRSDDRDQRAGRALPGYPLAEIPTIKRRLIEAGVDVIDLGAGDNDTPPPRRCVEAHERGARATRRYSKYGFQQGLPAFRQAASAGSSGGSASGSIRSPRLLPLIGSKEGLVAPAVRGRATRATSPSCPSPATRHTRRLASSPGAEPYIVPLRPENGLPARARPDPRGGARAREGRLRQLSQQPDRGGRAARVSGAHGRRSAGSTASSSPTTTRTATSPSTATSRRASSRSRVRARWRVEFFSLSKSFSMTGWRLGFAVGRAELIGGAHPGEVATWTPGRSWRCRRRAPSALDRARGARRADPRRSSQRRRDAGRGGAPRGRVRRGGAQGGDVPVGARCRRGSPRADSRGGRWRRRVSWCCRAARSARRAKAIFRIALTVGAERLREAAGPAGPDARGEPHEGSLPRPLDLGGMPRPPRRRPWIAIAVSVAVHVVAGRVRVDQATGCRSCRAGRRSSSCCAPPAEGPPSCRCAPDCPAEPTGDAAAPWVAVHRRCRGRRPERPS